MWSGILKGVTRDVVIEIATEAGHRVVETIINRYDLYTADEAFFTGTAAEIAPIRFGGWTHGRSREGGARHPGSHGQIPPVHPRLTESWGKRLRLMVTWVS